MCHKPAVFVHLASPLGLSPPLLVPFSVASHDLWHVISLYGVASSRLLYAGITSILLLKQNLGNYYTQLRLVFVIPRYSCLKWTPFLFIGILGQI